MKKPAKKTVKKTIKNKALSAKLHKLAVARAKKAAATRARNRLKHPTTVKKRTLSLNGPHVAASSWRDMLKLGRNKPDAAKPRLELDKYLACPDDLATPAVVDFASEVVTWPMYGNDRIGDCTAACVGHQIQAWTRYTGVEVDVPEADIIQLYSAVSGYDPQTGANDNGATVQDTLTYWRKSGVPVAGHKILAFAQLKDLSRVHDALWMFGSVYLGIECPESALQQFGADQPWTVVPYSPVAGGHAIPLQYADANGKYIVVTWGKLQQMDQQFLDTYVEEAWVIITDDWLNKNGNTPEGLNLQALGEDLAALTGDPNPFPAPQPPAPPVPTPSPPDPPAPAPSPTPPAPPNPDPKAVLEADLAILEQDIAKAAQDAERVP